jgi:iron(III) transport system ATP-binding protein
MGDDITDGMNVLEGKLLTKEFLGASATYRVALAGGAELGIIGNKHRQLVANLGDAVRVGIPSDAVQVLPHDVAPPPSRADLAA